MSDLIDDLEELRKALLSFSDRLEKSGVERTTGLKHAMLLGEDCPFYKKSRDIFLNRDYTDLKVLFLKVLKQYRIIEGDTFGR